MARLPRGGSAFAALYDLEISLASAVAEIGLRPLSEKEIEILRDALGQAIGLFLKNAGAQSSVDVSRTLTEIAQGCEVTSQTLNALTAPGLHHLQDLEVTHRLSETVAQDPAYRSLDAAQAFLEDFAVRASAVAHAARVSLMSLKKTKQKAGRDTLDWHDDFTGAVVRLCTWNEVKLSIFTDRETGEPGGRFLAVATGLEQLLYPEMRSPSLGALAQRLKRSLRRLKAPAGTKP